MTTLRKSPVRHPFRFKFELGDGKPVVSKVFATVLAATGSAEIMLYPENVEAAIKAHAVGDLSACSGSQCMRDPRNREALSGVIPEKILSRLEFGRFVDWQDSRVFITSKCDGTGMPNESVEFEQSSDVSKINDLGEKGMKALLVRLKKDGPMPIALRPVRSHKSSDTKPHKRKPTKSGGKHLKGAKRRFARVSPTGIAPL
jgi:hypothetical protein